MVDVPALFVCLWELMFFPGGASRYIHAPISSHMFTPGGARRACTIVHTLLLGDTTPYHIVALLLCT